jgi:hypothetical protein
MRCVVFPEVQKVVNLCLCLVPSEVRPVAIYLPNPLLSLATHATPDVMVASLTRTPELALLAVHAPAKGLVHTPDVPVERPDLLDGALVAVDLDPLDERADNLLARLADAHLEGRCDDNLAAVVKDLAFADLHAVEAGGHGLAPLEEAFVALVLATVRHVGRLVDEDVGRESGG